VYRPAYVPREAVAERVVLDGTELRSSPSRPAAPDGRGGDTRSLVPRSPATPEPKPRRGHPAPPGSATASGSAPGAARTVPLGRMVHARSGDKGGDANVGVWAVGAAARPDRVDWLLGFLTPDVVRTLLPETRGLDVEAYPLPNLGGVNIVVRGLLGQGVAASSRFDPQAKALGEWLRSRHVDVPEDLL
jgi:hypothetical protein